MRCLNVTGTLGLAPADRGKVNKPEPTDRLQSYAQRVIWILRSGDKLRRGPHAAMSGGKFRASRRCGRRRPFLEISCVESKAFITSPRDEGRRRA